MPGLTPGIPGIPETAGTGTQVPAYAGKRRRGRWVLALLAGAAVVLLAAEPVDAPRTPSPNVILIDEYWRPEILQGDVGARCVEADAPGPDAAARFGRYSLRLANESGAPNIRMLGHTIAMQHLPAEGNTASFWYRTDHWAGRWRLELWTHDADVAFAPVKIMEGVVDAGGPDGALIADDRWHPAAAALRPTDQFKRISHEFPRITYIWLRPLDGWGVAHRTYIDRFGLTVSSGPWHGRAAPDPPRRVDPRPGRETSGAGWVWWEGEDADDHDFARHLGYYLPNTAEQQALLSNGDWLHTQDQTGRTARYRVAVPTAGRYELWFRGHSDLQTTFGYRWDGGAWRTVDPAAAVSEVTKLHANCWAGWAKLDTLELDAGEHELELRTDAERPAVGIDCWLLRRPGVKPALDNRPLPAAATGER